MAEYETAQTNMADLELDISLNTIDKVKAFADDANRFDSEFDLSAGRYVINGKSIMCIFGLDLSKTVHLKVYRAPGDDIENIRDMLAAYSAG